MDVLEQSLAGLVARQDELVSTIRGLMATKRDDEDGDELAKEGEPSEPGSGDVQAGGDGGTGEGDPMRSNPTGIRPVLETSFVPRSPQHRVDQDDLEFLSEVEDFAGLDADGLAAMLLDGDIVELPPGGALFKIGDPCTSLFVIRSGMVEIRRPREDAIEGDDDSMRTVAFLGPKEVIGKMGVLSSGHHRSLATAPEGAEVLVINSEAYCSILLAQPELAVRMCRALATKLEGLVANLDSTENQHQLLHGSLRYFDLSSVLQSLVAADDHNGTFTIVDDDDDVQAELTVAQGRFRAARIGNLRGREAFFEIFLQDFRSHRFTFKGEPADVVKSRLDESSDLAEVPPMTLLLDAARIADEFLRQQSNIFTDADQVLKRNVDRLTWTDESTLPVAIQVWRRLPGPMPLSRVVSGIPFNRHVIYSVLEKMMEEGLIA